MFELPGAKRVKRADLFRGESPIRSESPSERQLDASPDPNQGAPSYGFEYEFVDVTRSADTSTRDNPPKPAADAPKSPNQDEQQAFDFRLFAPTKASSPGNTPTAPLARVTLRASPSPTSISLSEGKFLKPNRPETYYFTASIPSNSLQQLQQEYTSVAVTSQDVFTTSNTQKWPGSALPWRVIRLPSSTVHPNPTRTAEDSSSNLSAAAAATILTTQVTTNPRRTKPNKKRRIQLRKLITLRTKLSGEEKEKAIRDKRTLMNRKNKLKRRERERKKKKARGSTSQEGEENEGKMGEESVGAADGES